MIQLSLPDDYRYRTTSATETTTATQRLHIKTKAELLLPNDYRYRTTTATETTTTAERLYFENNSHYTFDFFADV